MNRLYALADRLFPALARGMVNARILSRDHGQARSIRERKPVDAAGEPIPWYTYPAIEYIRRFDLRAMSVFEFGAGNSSRFWAARAARVESVESDPAWHAALVAAPVPGLRVHLRQDKQSYVSCIAEQGRRFDVIVIDGRWRRSCARIAPEHLADGGMIIFDNADWHPQTTRELRGNGFFQIDFSGFGPINAYAWTTSIFLGADTRVQAGYTHSSPVGGLIDQDAEDC